MKELRRTEGGNVWDGSSAVWSLDDLDDEYGTMRVGSGSRLGMAGATMALHVKGMAAAKRKHLVSIMGDLSDDEERKDEEGPGVKALRVTSPKVVASVSEVQGDKADEPEMEAPRDAAIAEDDRSAGTMRTVESDDAVAATPSERHPSERSFDEKGEFC